MNEEWKPWIRLGIELVTLYLFNLALRRGLSRLRAVDRGVVYILGRLLTTVVVVITGLLVLRVLGVDTVPLLAFGGIGAAAAGIAGKDVIANLFGGLMLYITRPFIPGDTILLVEKNLEGTVEEIGWYLTSVRDENQRQILIPNALFSTFPVINTSRR